MFDASPPLHDSIDPMYIGLSPRATECSVHLALLLLLSRFSSFCFGDVDINGCVLLLSSFSNASTLLFASPPSVADLAVFGCVQRLMES